MSSEKHMQLWNRVCKTDPSHTKQVNQRGGFTSIGAQYQVQRATEQFGPCGEGWGYEVAWKEISATSSGKDREVVVCLQAADVTLWWKDEDGERHEFGPVRGLNPIIDDKGRLDDDAPKKAMTDAITKALSHLGFSADVYLGLWDDNKYVAQRRQEAATEKEPKADADQVDRLQSLIQTAKGPDADSYVREVLGKLRVPSLTALPRSRAEQWEQKLRAELDGQKQHVNGRAK